MLKIKDLKEQIKDLPDDMEVFIRCCSNPCGNIIEAGKASKDVYGFFGEHVDCIIIEPILDVDEDDDSPWNEDTENELNED
jgi:hypothetical protein